MTLDEEGGANRLNTCQGKNGWQTALAANVKFQQ